MRNDPATELAHTAWPDVPSDVLVLLPIGSTEQHGRHLPLDTDSVIAEAVARRAATAVPGTLVAPPLPYGASGEHAGFPGTVSIGHEALRMVLVEAVRSLALWAGRIVLVNGHGGNTATLDTAVRLLRTEGHDVAWTGCTVPRGDAHAGRTETSVMLHLTPDQVRLDAAVAGDTRPLAALLPELMTHGVRAVSPPASSATRPAPRRRRDAGRRTRWCRPRSAGSPPGPWTTGAASPSPNIRPCQRSWTSR